MPVAIAVLPDGVIPVGTAGVGLPLAVPYAATTSAVLAGFEAQIGVTIDQATYDLIASVLGDATNTPTGSVGQLTPGFNVFNGTPLGTINAPQSDIRTEGTWEVGYKGLLFDKLGVTLDVYNITAKNFTLFTAILLSLSGFSQSSQKMSYQAVVRDAGNVLIANTQLTIKTSILLVLA